MPCALCSVQYLGLRGVPDPHRDGLLAPAQLQRLRDVEAEGVVSAAVAPDLAPVDENHGLVIRSLQHQPHPPPRPGGVHGEGPGVDL